MRIMESLELAFTGVPFIDVKFSYCFLKKDSV